MDKIYSLLHSRKLLVLTCIIIFFLAAVIIYSVLFLPARQTSDNSMPSITIIPTASNKPKDNAYATPAITAIPATISTAQIIDNSSATDWIAGDHKSFTIDFPSNWTTEASYLAASGSAVDFKPAKLTNGDLLPRVHIEVSQLDPQRPLSSLIESLVPLNLQYTFTTFHGLPAVQLSGTLPFKPLPDNPNQNLIHKTYLFMQDSANQYIVSYAYYLDRNKETNLTLINTMLDSFQFKKPF